VLASCIDKLYPSLPVSSVEVLASYFLDAFVYTLGNSQSQKLKVKKSILRDLCIIYSFCRVHCVIY